MQVKSFKDVEKILAAIRPDIKAVNWFFALEDMQKFMHGLSDPQEKIRVVHVAGTSGKTSTCYYIANMLRLGGAQTGLTVSPHVDAVNERVQVDCQPLSQAEFCQVFDEFIKQPVVKSVDITYFGLLAAFAYWVFAQKQLDYAVIEVGMGGRMDATNVIENPSKICVITDIGLDHTQFLGKDIVTIAGEKAGIIKKGNQVFVANQTREVLDVFAAKAKQEGATLHVLPADKVSSAPGHLPPFQKRNWALASFVYEFIAARDNLPKLSPEKIAESAQVKIPARMEEFRVGDKIVITDGSHNGQKITALVAGLKQKYPGKEIATLISFVEGKDTTLDESLQALRKVSNNLIVTAFDNSQDIYRKSIDPSKIAEVAKQVGFEEIKVIKAPDQAFKELMACPQEILLVTGSFFLLNHIRPLIKKGIIEK